MRAKIHPGLTLILFACLMTACEREVKRETSGPSVGTPNPASDHCAEIGGKPGTHKLATGDEVAICEKDGKICDAWILMRQSRCEEIRKE